MVEFCWDDQAKLKGYQPVIDPRDQLGFKNSLIDAIHWKAIHPKLLNSSRFLDFGCGIGRFASRIIDLGIDYYGVDSSAKMVDAAKIAQKNLLSKFFQFNGIEIPFEADNFDTCLLCGVFQYIMGTSSQKKIVDELHRILVANGSLILLEQSSLSNKTSGTVTQVSTELDYIKALGKKFEIKDIRRIRRSEFLTSTKYFLHFAQYLPGVFHILLDFIAKNEIHWCQKANESYFSEVDYYDILIEAIAK